MNEIEQLKNEFIKQLSPEKIYLFGSFATGTNTEESDLDFYIVVNDTVTDLLEVTANAYKSIRKIKQRPVDIIVGLLDVTNLTTIPVYLGNQECHDTQASCETHDSSTLP